MRLSTLVGSLAVEGDLGRDPEVSGVQHDSRRVEPGDLFVTWSGARHEGRLFARQAFERGAVAVIADRPRPDDLAPEAVWLLARDPRGLLGDLAAPLYGHPDRELVVVGVTGTNGKSTVTELAAAMLDAAELPAGRIGTLGARFRGADWGSERTTPEASDLFRIFSEMKERGARAVAMEVSSHALVQGRVRGAAFDVGVFLNLTRDHFDFHADFEDYFAAKSRLFEQLKAAGRAVVNADDAWGQKLLARLPAAISFGAEGAVRPAGVELGTAGIRGAIDTPRGRFEFSTPLLGRYNLDNLLAAAAVGEALALPHASVARGMAATRPLPGRLEPIDCGQPFPVLVDYAHTDAALEAALRAVREFAGRRIVCVFGCGGDRDPGKRPLMGKIAGQLADLPIVTSDNPRSEDPINIIAAIEEGLKASGNAAYRVVPDRREAIRRAVAVAAQGGWTVLVAGKGHEREQIIGNQRLPFSDREELERALGERYGVAVRG
jgi:UDP-N-acetylmuramoyl-L-alanyl-D-glutamate--2,6-diaminopimelate ligase